MYILVRTVLGAEKSNDFYCADDKHWKYFGAIYSAFTNIKIIHQNKIFHSGASGLWLVSVINTLPTPVATILTVSKTHWSSVYNFGNALSNSIIDIPLQLFSSSCAGSFYCRGRNSVLAEQFLAGLCSLVHQHNSLQKLSGHQLVDEWHLLDRFGNVGERL